MACNARELHKQIQQALRKDPKKTFYIHEMHGQMVGWMDESDVCVYYTVYTV